MQLPKLLLLLKRTCIGIPYIKLLQKIPYTMCHYLMSEFLMYPQCKDIGDVFNYYDFVLMM